MKKFTTLSAILLALCLCFTACATPVDSSSLNSSSSYLDSSQELDYYVVTYTENGNRGEIKVKKGESCTPYTPAPREGYVFTGWFLNGTLINGSFIPEGDVEIEGIWERYDLLAEELKASLKKYLSSEAFAKAVTDAKTTQARIPLLYLKYIDGNYYTPELVEQFKNYLNMIDGVILNGKISDSLYSSSDVSKTGWYGIPDFLYSWSAIYNQYALASVALKYDNAYGKYFDLISEYLTNLEKYQSNSSKKYEWNGEEVTQSNLYYKGYNAINNIANASSRLSKDEFVSLLNCIATATQNTDGHAAFIAKYETIDFESMDADTYKLYKVNDTTYNLAVNEEVITDDAKIVTEIVVKIADGKVVYIDAKTTTYNNTNEEATTDEDKVWEKGIEIVAEFTISYGDAEIVIPTVDLEKFEEVSRPESVGPESIIG